MVQSRNLRWFGLLLFAIAASVSLTAYSYTRSAGHVILRQTAQSSIEMENRKDGLYISTENQRYSFIEKNSRSGNPEWFLLQETLAATDTSRDDRVSHDVTVKAWSWSPDERKADEKWAIHEIGDEGEAGDASLPFYKVTRYGCCGERTVYSYFAFDSGKRMYQSSFDLADVLVLNVFPLKERFIAYDDSMGEAKALLSYGSVDHLISKISIEGIGSIYETETKIGFLYKGKPVKPPLELDEIATSAGETSPFNFAISLQYSDGEQIDLEIRNDDIDLASSVIPNRIKVSKVN